MRTGSARAGLFRLDGTQVGRGEHPIVTWKTHPDHVEQSSDDIWAACCAAVRDAVASSGVNPSDIRGIGFDATCSLVAIDAQGQPVSVSLSGDDARNVVVWMDHRATRDAAEINETGHRVLEFVGSSISPEMQTPKLRWLKRELPECWRRTRHWFDLPDFLTWRATGSNVRSLCSTVCKWTFLGHEGEWDASYFRTLGLGDLVDDQFQRIGKDVRSPGDLAGKLSGQAARELGLPSGIPVAVSLIDAHAGALGTIGAGGSDAALERRFRADGFTTELRYGDAADPIGAVLAITDEHGNRVDFIVGLRGLDAGAYSRTIEIPFHGEPLRIVGVEDFIAMKLFAHGPQDLADARSALDAAGDNLDLPLLRRLAERFGQETARALDAALRAR